MALLIGFLIRLQIGREREIVPRSLVIYPSGYPWFLRPRAQGPLGGPWGPYFPLGMGPWGAQGPPGPWGALWGPRVYLKGILPSADP